MLRQAHRASVVQEQDFEDDSENAVSMDLGTSYLFAQKTGSLPTEGQLTAAHAAPAFDP